MKDENITREVVIGTTIIELLYEINEKIDFFKNMFEDSDIFKKKKDFPLPDGRKVVFRVNGKEI